MRATKIRVFGLLGVLLCLYAIYVEYQKTASPDFVALCDISEKISCSKVINRYFPLLYAVPSEASSFSLCM
jgi:uncharacterized membrane protein